MFSAVNKGLLTCAAVVMSFIGASQANAGTISTIPIWNGQSQNNPFGPSTATFASAETWGQTFTVTDGLGTKLDNFSFFLGTPTGSPITSGTDTSHFSAYVMAWDGNKATGAVLYTSPSYVIPASGQGFTEFTFNTGGVNLNAGTQYVAFLSTLNYSDGNTETGFALIGPSVVDGQLVWNPNAYSGGGLVYAGRGVGASFSELTTSSWSTQLIPLEDTAFQATFSSSSPVPEPSTLVLMALGGIGFAIRAYRRRVAA